MKKVEIPQTEQPEINWSKQQWVQYKDNQNLIILTTGRLFANKFEGTAMPCDQHPYGLYSKEWDKDNFKLLTTEIPFIISNND